MAPLRFAFVARELIQFPEGKSANILRGAFGVIFRRIACVPECQSAGSCEVRAQCAYARLFEPAAVQAGPSGLADWPRPFVFRASHLDGETFGPGEGFHFDVNLFDLAPQNVDYLIRAFAEFGREGLGVGRRKVELITVTALSAPGLPVYVDGVVQANRLVPLALDLAAGGCGVSRMTVRFLTPTELKSGQQLVARPDFGVVAARARDRISTLRELYGDGPLVMNFKAFGERARRIEMTECRIRQVQVERRSSRTGQTHSIGGFVGEADYEGELDEFVPYLKAAEYTGIGRQTVWGKGWIEVRC